MSEGCRLIPGDLGILILQIFRLTQRSSIITFIPSMHFKGRVKSCRVNTPEKDSVFVCDPRISYCKSFGGQQNQSKTQKLPAAHCFWCAHCSRSLMLILQTDNIWQSPSLNTSHQHSSLSHGHWWQGHRLANKLETVTKTDSPQQPSWKTQHRKLLLREDHPVNLEGVVLCWCAKCASLI